MIRTLHDQNGSLNNSKVRFMTSYSLIFMKIAAAMLNPGFPRPGEAKPLGLRGANILFRQFFLKTV